MRAASLLLLHSLRRIRVLVLTMGALLAAFQFVLILSARSIQGNGGFEQLASLIPQFARELLGPALLSFAGIVALGYFHVAVMGALVGISIAVGTIPASEVESGFIDLILSRPLARHWVITRTFVALCLTSAVVLCFMMFGTWSGLNMLTPGKDGWPSQELILSLVLNLAFLMLCWGGIASAIGAQARRRSVAGAFAGLLALASFLLDYIGRLWEPAESVAWLSPFRYFAPFDLVAGQPLPAKDLQVLGAISAAGFAAAYLLYSRRDISR